MKPQNIRQSQRETDPQKQPAGNGEPAQISLPNNDERQTGPFEHSGETARQTEEARKEEAEQKD